LLLLLLLLLFCLFCCPWSSNSKLLSPNFLPPAAPAATVTPAAADSALALTLPSFCDAVAAAAVSVLLRLLSVPLLLSMLLHLLHMALTLPSCCVSRCR
jgi:hypothetical protein